jgi:hypothetical protein
MWKYSKIIMNIKSETYLVPNILDKEYATSMGIEILDGLR